jgi:hypothetical protein
VRRAAEACSRRRLPPHALLLLLIIIIIIIIVGDIVRIHQRFRAAVVVVPNSPDAREA